MIDDYFVYIDEAGDEGFGKLRTSNSGGQSRWLMLGAIIVSKENDRLLPRWRNEIMDAFPNKRRRDLHFHKLKHDQKVAACRFLADKRFGACVICSDKSTIPNLQSDLLKVYKQKGHLYNYLVRYLLERVSQACAHKSRLAGHRARLHITFSKRDATDYDVMRDYLYLMRDGKEKLKPIRSVNWSALNPEDIKVEDHANRAGLQLADVVTSATYNAFEPNLYGDTEPRYATFFRDRYIKDRGTTANCGITIMPKNTLLTQDMRDFLNKLG